ncbi:BtaA family protein [Undibacterium sp. 14-3-2]|uniref:DUF3419 family protein n=1 Tax=Undibacterium sp. 14-3-2 TaxID=2800129 RepID=UPI0019057969|nr:DUF3419 family protein [Undibacterium sp. 14-3-2]MBK1888475.1 BtaA family protein [Undibacterium sp. 14-3-2]
MSSKALIASAVFNSTTQGRKGVADKLFAHWFSRLVHAQIWEDPQADLHALQLRPGANIVTISSGGCNALAYLSAEPAAVHAVDLNAAHLAMLNIKQTAIKHLPDYDAVLAYLGDANHADNLKRYKRHIRQHLSEDASSFWESRTITGKPRYHYFTDQAYQHGLLGRFISFAHGFVRLMGGDMSKMLEARSVQEQRDIFDHYIAPVFDTGLFKLLAQQPLALYSIGVPLSQFAALKKDAGEGLHVLFKERMRHLSCDFPLDQNCFAQQAFGRRYDIRRQTALPMYLQQAHFFSLRRNIDRLHAHHLTMTDFLRTQPRASMDAYVFLDAQDWMDQSQLTSLWEEVNRTAAPGARVVFRTAGQSSPLEAALPSTLLSTWHTDTGHNRALHALDRSAIYGGMHLYQKT